MWEMGAGGSILFRVHARAQFRLNRNMGVAPPSLKPLLILIPVEKLVIVFHPWRA